MGTDINILPPRVLRAVSESGLAERRGDYILEQFVGHFDDAMRASKTAEKVADDDAAGARKARLKLKAIRVDAEKTRVTLKSDALAEGKAIDAVARFLREGIEESEAGMEAIEKAAERAEAARIAKLVEVRREALTPYCDPTHFDLGNMSEEAFVDLLAGQVAAKAARDAAAAKAQADRLAAEEADRKRRAEEAAESARLRAEIERMAAERKAAEEEARKERERVAAEQRKARADADAREAAARAEERAKTEAAERLAKRARDDANRLALEKARSERAEAERAEEAARAARKAAAAPDRDKLMALAERVRAIEIPSLSSEQGKEVERKVREAIDHTAGWITRQANGL